MDSTSGAEVRGFVFGTAEARPADSYQVQFGGVVDGFALPGENVGGKIEARLIPNGVYDWTIKAETDSGEPATTTGTLKVENSDSKLPDISSFSISPETFTPNQDGVHD